MVIKLVRAHAVTQNNSMPIIVIAGELLSLQTQKHGKWPVNEIMINECDIITNEIYHDD